MNKNKIIIMLIIVLFIIIIIFFINKTKNNNNIDSNSNNNKINNNNLNNNTNEITFGNYYINDDKNMEPIEWIILDTKDDKILITTKYAINSIKFNNSLDNITWSNSDIRNWLNNNFYNNSFNEDEKNLIIKTKIDDEEDNIFLLSYDDVNNYFKTSNDRLLKPTNYAVLNGCYTNNLGNSSWWTRTISNNKVDYIATSGEFGTRSHAANETIIGTRPAMWIKNN